MNVLTECLAQGTSPVGVVSFAKEYLKQQGFEELYYNKMISPKENSKYYIAPFPDVLFAFTTGNAKANSGWFQSAASTRPKSSATP